jgi:hypothetical protein
MQQFQEERMILSAAAVRQMECVIEECARYTSERRIFGRTVLVRCECVLLVEYRGAGVWCVCSFFGDGVRVLRLSLSVCECVHLESGRTTNLPYVDTHS